MGLQREGILADLIEGLLPKHRVHLIGGSGGAGKTTLLAWLLGQIQEGQEVLGRPSNPQPGGVYYIAADQPWEDYQKVLQRVNLQPTGYYSFSDDPKITHARFASPDPLPLLKYAFAAADPQPNSVVVVDIFGLFLGPNLTDYRAVMGYMWEYGKWCLDRKVTIIGSVHAGKQKAGLQERYVRLFDRVIGGNPMRCACSTAMYLTSKEETGQEKGYQEFEVNPRHETTLRFQVQWNQDGLLVPTGYLATEGLETAEHHTLLQFFPYQHKDKDGIKATDLEHKALQSLQISRATFYRWLSKLSEEGYVGRTAITGGWVRIQTSC